jgi:hypothetical protein
MITIFNNLIDFLFTEIGLIKRGGKNEIQSDC